MATPKHLSKCIEDIQTSWKREDNLSSLWKDWEKIAGEKLSSNCKLISLNRGILIIGARHPQWRQAILYTRTQLLASLRSSGYEIKDIKIQQSHPKEKLSLENAKKMWGLHPSRVDIHGMTICKQCNKPAPKGEINLWKKCGLCRRKDLR